MSIKSGRKLRNKKITWSQHYSILFSVLDKGDDDVNMVPVETFEYCENTWSD